MNNEQLEQINQYTYLGVAINIDVKIDEEINNRIAKANNIYYQLNHTILGKKEINTKTKIQVYNTIYVPTLIYGSESWTINKRVESRITASEMKCLRKIHGVTRKDKIRNQNIRLQLQTKPLIDNIHVRSLQWLGHITRMSEERLPKRVMEARPIGTRSKGRPRTEWSEYMISVASNKGKTIEEAKKLATNRKEYRKWTLTPETVTRRR